MEGNSGYSLFAATVTVAGFHFRAMSTWSAEDRCGDVADATVARSVSDISDRTA